MQLYPFPITCIHKTLPMLELIASDRLQTGMRNASGKCQGIVARVHKGQVIMSTLTKLQNNRQVTETLLEALFKFSGHQKIPISQKWGFMKFNVDEFENMVAEKVAHFRWLWG